MYHRVLITGANGLVGQALVHQLSQDPLCDVLATGRDNTAFVEGHSFGYTQMDICRPAEIEACFQDFEPSVVIHCAAMTQVDICEEQKAQCWQTNVDATKNIAKLCKRFGSRLIHISTDFIFDGQKGRYKESDRPGPVNYYGKSKLAAENAVQGSGLMRWNIVRPVLIFGTGNNLSRSNIALWVINKLNAGEDIRVVDDQWRTPTYVHDLAIGIHQLIKAKRNGIFNLAGPEYLSVFDFACKIAHVLDLDLSKISRTDSKTLGELGTRPLKTGFEITKARDQISFNPQTLDQSIAKLGNILDRLD